jgi:hypothetical protein
MSKHHPYHERGKGLINAEGPTTVCGEGQYPDGQDQHGVTLDRVNHGETPHYAHAHGHRYREDLRERPSAKPHKIFGKAARPESRRMPTRSKS